MRVLHLIDPGSPGGGACTLRLLAEVLRGPDGARHDVVIIGSAAHAALARRCGVRILGSMCPPVAMPASGAKLLRRALEDRSQAGVNYDLLHAWTPRAAAIAAKASLDVPVLGTLQVGPIDDDQTRALRRASRLDRVQLLAGSPAVQRAYRAAGFDATQMTLLPPGVNPEQTELADRQAIRARWRAENQFDDGTMIVGLLCEPVSWPDVRAAAGVVARLRLSGRETRLVVHQCAARRVEAEHYLRDVGMSELLIVDDAVAEPWTMVAGLDVAMIVGAAVDARHAPQRASLSLGAPIGFEAGLLQPLPSVLPLLWAFAAGVPVVADDTDATRSIIDRGITGVLIPPHDVNAATDCIARMIDDSGIGRRIGRAASQAAHELFHIDAYRVRLTHAYELLAARRGAAAGAAAWTAE